MLIHNREMLDAYVENARKRIIGTIAMIGPGEFRELFAEINGCESYAKMHMRGTHWIDTVGIYSEFCLIFPKSRLFAGKSLPQISIFESARKDGKYLPVCSSPQERVYIKVDWQDGAILTLVLDHPTSKVIPHPSYAYMVEVLGVVTNVDFNKLVERVSSQVIKIREAKLLNRRSKEDLKREVIKSINTYPFRLSLIVSFQYFDELNLYQKYCKSNSKNKSLWRNVSEVVYKDHPEVCPLALYDYFHELENANDHPTGLINRTVLLNY